MTPRIARKIKRKSLNGQSFKVSSPKTSRGVIYDAYIASGLDSLKYSIFQRNFDHQNIWDESMRSPKFLNKCLGSRWLRRLDRKEKAHVLKIFNRFVNDCANTKAFLRKLRCMTFPEVIEEVSKIETDLNDILGINFAKRWETFEHVVIFEDIWNFVSHDASYRMNRKHRFRRSQFLEPMLLNFVLLYIRCLIDSIRKTYECEVERSRIVKWESRFANDFPPNLVVPHFETIEMTKIEAPENEVIEIAAPENEVIEIAAPGANSQSVTLEVSQTAKWVEEFVGFSNRIKIKEFVQSRRSWFTRALVSNQNEYDLFTMSFVNHSFYHLPKSALQYLREIDRNSRKNFKSLVKNGEFKRLSRQILNGYVGNNDIQQRGELHDVLGELMVVIGKRILQFGNLQLLTGQLESFVRKLSYSRDFVFCEDNVDLVENFDPEIEDCLARLLEGCHGFSVEKSMVHMKCAIIRYVIRVAVHILRNVVRVKLAEGEIRSFIYDDTFEFEPLSSPNAPQSASITIHRETGRSSMECVYIGNPVGMTPRIAKQIKRKSLDKGQNCKVASKKSRLYDDEIIEIAAPGVNSQSVTLEVSQTAKWVEEFIGFSNRIKIKEFVQSHRNWFTRALVKKPDECNLFVTSFPNYNSYYLPKRALQYLREIDRNSRKNFESLVKNGEFRRLSRQVLNGYVGNNDIQQRGELHDVLGELMVVIGKRILQFGNLQLLTGQLESFVRKISYSRDFVFCEDNADLVEKFDPEIEDCLARLLEGCNGFSIEKSMVHMKCAIIRYVIRVAVHILRNVVIVKLENREIKSFIYDNTLEFEPSSTPNTPKSASITIHRQTGRSMECVDIGNPVRSKARVLENSEKSTSHHNSHSSKMLKKAGEDDRIPEEMFEFMSGIVSENEMLKRELNYYNYNNNL